IKTLLEAETARRRAVVGLRNLGRDRDADRIERMSTNEYASTKGFELIEGNPLRRTTTMPRRSKDQIISDLQDQVADLESENEDLQSRLDEIADVVSGPGEGDEGDEDDDQD